MFLFWSNRLKNSLPRDMMDSVWPEKNLNLESQKSRRIDDSRGGKSVWK